MGEGWRILVAGELIASAQERLRAVGKVVVVDGRDEAGILTAIEMCEALVVRTSARVTRRVIEAGARLKVIGRAGVGLDNVDVVAARERGIEVVYTPAASTRAVAEMTVGLMLALERHIGLGDRMARDGRFSEARKSLLSRELHECALGIVGMGRIGKAVGRIAAAGLGMRVIFNDIVDAPTLDFAAESVGKETLFGTADVVTLHVPLTELTRGLVSDNTLAQFKRRATLINTSRGAVIDSQAVARALDDGRLGGLAVDVLDEEPPSPEHPLLLSPRTLVSPHLSSRTPGALSRMNDVVDDVIRALRGDRVAYSAFDSGAAAEKT
jgi:D-3-phosphoglycerate dehydrogenase